MKQAIKSLGKVRVQRLRDLKQEQWRELIWMVASAVLLVAGALWFASRFVEPAPPKTIVMSTGVEGGGYHAFGKRYAEFLKRSGVTLELRASAGSLENVRRINDAESGVSVTLLQGGVTDANSSPNIMSLGRVFLEPLWVFYRGSETIDQLGQLRDKRIAIGPEGSGTRFIAISLLEASGIPGTSSTLLPLTGNEAATALQRGEVDAVVLALAPQAPVVQDLIKAPDIRLMSMSQAEAYTRRLPYLSRIVLPKGVFDLSKNVPAADVELVAPIAALVARDDLHPAIVGLLVEAAKQVHAPGGMFNRIGEFPKAQDPEFEMSVDAERVYKNGPPFLQRYLPFWLATFLERMRILILPILTIMLPLVKLVPALFKWRVRRRLLYWYSELKELEGRIATDASPTALDQHRKDYNRIAQGVDYVPVPVGYSEQFYSLRAAIDLVRQRLEALQGSVKLA